RVAGDESFPGVGAVGEKEVDAFQQTEHQPVVPGPGFDAVQEQDDSGAAEAKTRHQLEQYHMSNEYGASGPLAGEGGPDGAGFGVDKERARRLVRLFAGVAGSIR